MISSALAFITSPIGRYVAIGLFILGAYWAGYYGGHSSATTRCRAAALQSKLDAQERDLAAAQEAAAAAEQARKDIEQTSAIDRERIAAYEKELATRPSGACALTPDDLRVLDGKPDGQQAHPPARNKRRPFSIAPASG